MPSSLPPRQPASAPSTARQPVSRLPTSTSSPSPYLKHRSLILAVGVAIIAASGALIGASFRAETQKAAASGASPFSIAGFSTFSSAQAIGSEARASSDLSTHTDHTPSPSTTTSSAASTSGKEAKSDIQAQIESLQRRRAALWQQRLITEKKMQGLRERQAAKDEKERGEEKRGFKKYGS